MERIGPFRLSNVLVITLPGLIVVAQYADARNDIGQPVFIAVLRSRERPWKLEDGKLDERFFRSILAALA